MNVPTGVTWPVQQVYEVTFTVTNFVSTFLIVRSFSVICGLWERIDYVASTFAQMNKLILTDFSAHYTIC